jgi:hypothetical protein
LVPWQVRESGCVHAQRGEDLALDVARERFACDLADDLRRPVTGFVIENHGYAVSAVAADSEPRSAEPVPPE